MPRLNFLLATLTPSHANRMLQACSSIIFGFSNVCLQFSNTKIPCKIITLTQMINKCATKSIMHPSYSLASKICIKSPKSVYKSKWIMLKSMNSKTLTNWLEGIRDFFKSMILKSRGFWKFEKENRELFWYKGEEIENIFLSIWLLFSLKVKGQI